MFLCKRARPDIATAVAFLTTRVQAPDIDDWKKMMRMLHYLNATKNLFLTLLVDSDGVLVAKWWVDGAFAIHEDMRSQTGVVMSMGQGEIYNSSTRQKLNTKSSTEAELVAANNTMPQILWTSYFLRAQGYDLKETILYQDNQAAIFLEKNGRLSSGERTRHINIRYFFIKDYINNNELQVNFCGTDSMLGDIHTKPLQGSKFKKFRDAILGISEINT